MSKHADAKRTDRVSQRWSGVLALLAVLALALTLVACGKSRVRSSGAAQFPAPGQSVANPGQSIIVRRGDTIYRLATQRNINPQDLAAWNGIRPPYTIYPGQRLNLYPSRNPSQRPQSTRRPAQTPSTTPPRTAAPAPRRSPFAWRWPTAGQVGSRFVEGDTTRQGIDITGRSGQPVHAAAGGEVVYSGSALVGYGELVVIKHDEQWLSAYGHNRRRLVSEGARVRAGEQIAEMGHTGSARDMLHFEIRYNGKPVDPLLYLPER